jgi:glycosyltransferase involved in cell wall biosynthesis
MERLSSLPVEHIWCAIPVYNNKDTVKSVAVECRSLIPQVVVVDDGSTDADVGELLSNSGVTVLRHGRNRGKGGAILTALQHVKEQGGRFMITLDADGQHHPRDLVKFIPLLQGDETAILIGCRQFDAESFPRRSRVGMEIGNFWLRTETGASVEDSQSGFRAYPVGYLSELKLVGSRFEFEGEVLARAVWAGLELKNVPVGVWYPEPRLRVSSFRPFVDNLRISLMHARLVGRRLLPFPHRRLIPAAEERLDPRMLLHPIKMVRGLIEENATPALLGVSAAVGTFLATLPLIFLHTVVIVYFATRLRLNRVMAVAVQNLCMPPFVPMLCIELGYRMRYGEWLTEFSKRTILNELHLRVFEWLLGSLVVAPIAAVVVGGAVFLIAGAIQSRVRRQGNGRGA